LNGTRMAGTNNFNLGNLTDNPNFDFLKILSSFSDDNDFENSSSFLNNSENDSPYNASSFNSVYTDITSMCNSPLNNNINIMSLNVQSLPSKFSELNDLIETCSSKNFLPDIILLQEIWQVTDPNIFSLNHYQPLIFKCRSSCQGGGGWHLCKERC
jgi:hypothetical protein